MAVWLPSTYAIIIVHQRTILLGLVRTKEKVTGAQKFGLGELYGEDGREEVGSLSPLAVARGCFGISTHRIEKVFRIRRIIQLGQGVLRE